MPSLMVYHEGSLQELKQEHEGRNHGRKLLAGSLAIALYPREGPPLSVHSQDSPSVDMTTD